MRMTLAPCLLLALTLAASAADVEPIALPADVLAPHRRGLTGRQLDRLAAHKRYALVRIGDQLVARLRDGDAIRFERPIDARQAAVIRALYGPEPPLPWTPPADGAGVDLATFEATLPADERAAVARALRRLGPRAAAFAAAVQAFTTPADRREALWLLARLEGKGARERVRTPQGLRGRATEDLDRLTAAEFHETVHYALLARRRYAWCRSLSPGAFRRHVLPHRGSQEPWQRWRGRFHRALAPVADTSTDVRALVRFVNTLAAAIFRYRGDTGWEDQGPLTLLATHEGRCEDMVNLTNYLLRAVGVPSEHVYTPAWARSDGNHAWCGVPLAGGELLSFMGCEPAKAPPYFRRYMTDIVAAKVYMQGPFGRRDVTDQYGPTTTLALATGAASTTLHLNVYNHDDWRTVATTRSDAAGRVTITRLGCKAPILYLLTRDHRGFGSGAARPVGGPLVVGAGGRPVRRLTPGRQVEVILDGLPPAGALALQAWVGPGFETVRTLTRGAPSTLVEGVLYRVMGGGRPHGRPFVIEGGRVVRY